MPAAAWEFTAGGVRVLERWFRLRAAAAAGLRTDGEVPDGLDAVGARGWTREWTSELLELITVLALVDGAAGRRKELAARLDAGPLIGPAELRSAGCSRPPPGRGGPRRCSDTRRRARTGSSHCCDERPGRAPTPARHPAVRSRLPPAGRPPRCRGSRRRTPRRAGGVTKGPVGGYARGMNTTPLPLEGVTVVAVEQAVAAPFATRQLADLGARVVKVERPDGGDFARGYDTAARGLASHFVWCNRGKESLAVDLKDPRGLAIVRELVAGADVFVQNLAQGAAARLGLDAASLCAAHPRLVAVDISGYGAGGPYAHKRAYDMLVQCEAGLVSVTGTAAQPVKAGVPAADIAAAMYAFSGVLAALLRRATTGRGGPVEVSMLDALAEWMGHPLHQGMHGSPPRRVPDSRTR